VLWRSELRVIWPVGLVLAIGVLASSALYDRSVPREAAEALVVTALLGLPLGLWIRRWFGRRLPVAEVLPSGTLVEPRQQTTRRTLCRVAVLALLVVVLAPAFEGDISDIAGFFLAVALGLLYMERRLARWETDTGALVWIHPRGRGRGFTLYSGNAASLETRS